MGLICLITAIVMMGWWANWPWVLSLGPGAPTMKFNTALLFFLSAIGSLLSLNDSIKWIRWFIGFSISLIATASLIQEVALQDFGLDQLFANDPYSVHNPGRMSPATAVCFQLLGITY